MGRARIGMAVLGAGSIAEYHLAGLAATGRADVRVVAGRTPDKVARLAARFGVPEASTDVAETLARADVEAVVIATPDDTHEGLAIAAAQAGKAILLQKPMAASVATGQRIIDAAARCGVDLQVSFMHRYFDEVVQARQWLEEGLLGRVLGARVRNATPGPDWGTWFFRGRAFPTASWTSSACTGSTSSSSCSVAFPRSVHRRGRRCRNDGCAMDRSWTSRWSTTRTRPTGLPTACSSRTRSR